MSGSPNQPFDVSMGFQYTFLRLVSLRYGMLASVNAAQKTVSYPDISFGAGMWYHWFGCDYSLSMPYAGTEIMIHRISLNFYFPFAD